MNALRLRASTVRVQTPLPITKLPQVSMNARVRMDFLATTATRLQTSATATHVKTVKQMTAARTRMALTRAHANLVTKVTTAPPTLTSVQAGRAKTVLRVTTLTRMPMEWNPASSGVPVWVRITESCATARLTSAVLRPVTTGLLAPAQALGTAVSVSPDMTAIIAATISTNAHQPRARTRQRATKASARTAAPARLDFLAQIATRPLTTVPPPRANMVRPVQRQKLPTHAHALQASLAKTVMQPTPAQRRTRASMLALVMALPAAQCAHAPWVGMVMCATQKRTSAHQVRAYTEVLAPTAIMPTRVRVRLALRVTIATRLQILAPQTLANTVVRVARETTVPHRALVQPASSVTYVRATSMSARRRRA